MGTSLADASFSMAASRGQLTVALAVAGIGLAGCIVVREKDPCANDACDSIPLPDRNATDVERTEPTTTKSAPLSGTAADSGPDNGAAKDAGAEAASPPTGKTDGEACSDKLDCDGINYCCFFPGPGPSLGTAACASQSDCLMRGSFFVCVGDSDCPSPRKCLAETNTGHRACI